MDDQKVIGVTPDISELTFIAILRSADSPALSSAHAVYQYCVKRGVSPAFVLSIFLHESSLGKAGTATITRSWGNTRLPTHGGVTPVRMTTAGEARSGVFPVFRDWIDGGIATVARLVDYAPYQGKTTVGQIIPTWAPASDMNNPAVYVRAVLAQMTAWQAQDKAASAAKGGSMTVQKPPFTAQPSPNRGYAGAAYKPEAVVWHITEGSGQSAVNWLTSPASGASSNFVVLEGGQVVQLVDPEAGPNGAAWANGAINTPNLNNPLVAAWIKSGVNPNLRTVSIEHAGNTSYGKGGSLTAAQVATTIRLTAWLCQRFGIAPDRDHIIPHAYVDSVNRANCPGFSEAEWNSRIVQIAALVGGTTIGGTIADGIGKVPVEAAAPAQEGIVGSYVDKPGQGVYWGVDEQQEPFVVIKPGGQMKEGTVNVNLADLGFTGTGMDDAQYSISLKQGQWDANYTRNAPGKS